MKIKTITYKRVKNLGNYNSEHLELSAEVEDDETHSLDIQVQILKTMVERNLGIYDDKSDEIPFK